MAGAYIIDEGRSLVLSRGWGVLTDEDLLGHARALGADPRFRPHFAQLSDLLGITKVEVTPTGIAELASLNPFGVGARRALVVDGPLAYGLSRMYQILRDNKRDELEIFRNLDAAVRWLGFEGEADAFRAALAGAPELKTTA